MSRPPLTRRQRQILDFLRAYTAENGISPTLAEIAEHFGVNKVTIFGHVAELERKGVIARAAPGISRGLQVVEDERGAPRAQAPLRTGPLEVLGTIAAGSPIEAVEEPEHLDLDDLVPPGAEVYVLRVRGNSMVEDAICDGDLVLVERTAKAANGQTVVAVLPDGEATLKRFYEERGRYRLQPANASMQPIYTDELTIRGVVVGVIRRF